MFTKHNEILPMFDDFLMWSGTGDKKVLVLRDPLPSLESIDPPAHRRSKNPEDPDYAPWCRSKILVGEVLKPSPDDADNNPSLQADNGPESVTVGIALLYPPHPPVVGKDMDGQDLLKPISDEWLFDMLREQEVRHRALKAASQDLLQQVRKAATNVTLLRTQIKAEKSASDDLMRGIKNVCGSDVYGAIVRQTMSGLTKDNLYAEEPFGDMLLQRADFNKPDPDGVGYTMID